MAVQGLGGRIDARLEMAFDWLTGLPRADAVAMRREVMHTVMLQPAPLLLTSLGLVLMSASAMIVTGAAWARIWFAIDLFLVLARMAPTMIHVYRGTEMSLALARRLVCLVFVTLFLFGCGCAASFLTGVRPLPVVATASMMGLIAGLATRWAALPRLAIVSILLFATPFWCAMFGATNGGRTGALQFAVVAIGTALLTLQNQRTLIAMLRAERRARQLASTDPLTGLGNRSALEADLGRIEEEASAGERGLATLFVDLDGFKLVNDEHGHAVGDMVLLETASRLRTAAAPHHAYRIGGDEFVVLISDEIAVAEAVSDNVLERLGRPIPHLADGTLRIGASIGIAYGILGPQSVAEIFAQADGALYRIKKSGGGARSSLPAMPHAALG